jgi:hypothetical protein
MGEHGPAGWSVRPGRGASTLLCVLVMWWELGRERERASEQRRTPTPTPTPTHKQEKKNVALAAREPKGNVARLAPGGCNRGKRDLLSGRKPSDSSVRARTRWLDKIEDKERDGEERGGGRRGDTHPKGFFGRSPLSPPTPQAIAPGRRLAGRVFTSCGRPRPDCRRRTRGPGVGGARRSA